MPEIPSYTLEQVREHVLAIYQKAREVRPPLASLLNSGSHVTALDNDNRLLTWTWRYATMAERAQRSYDAELRALIADELGVAFEIAYSSDLGLKEDFHAPRQPEPEFVQPVRQQVEPATAITAPVPSPRTRRRRIQQPADFDYQRYLASREWALLKEQVRERNGGWCEHCHAAPHQDTHHLTYERVGQENLDDLLGLCRPCHEWVSGKTHINPLGMSWLISEPLILPRINSERLHIAVANHDDEYMAPGFRHFGTPRYVSCGSPRQSPFGKCKWCETLPHELHVFLGLVAGIVAGGNA